MMHGPIHIKIYLFENGSHFDVINSMKALLGSCCYCNKCDKPYNNKNSHKCSTHPDVCKLCKNPCILRKQKIKYIVKTAIVTVLTRFVLITIIMFARKLINAKFAIKLF